jgi:hypothetical protein
MVVERGCLWLVSFQDYLHLGTMVFNQWNKEADFLGHSTVQVDRWAGCAEVVLSDVIRQVGFCVDRRGSGFYHSLAEFSAFCGLSEADVLGAVGSKQWDNFPRTDDVSTRATLRQMASNAQLPLVRAAFGAQADAFYRSWQDGKRTVGHSGWAQRFRCAWRIRRVTICELASSSDPNGERVFEI